MALLRAILRRAILRPAILCSQAARSSWCPWLLKAGIVAWIAGAPALLPAQLLYYPEPLLVDGEPAPGLGTNLDNLDRPALNPQGVLMATADLDGTVADEVLIVNGVVVAQEGQAVPGVPGGLFGSFDEITTRHPLNVHLEYAYVAVMTGVATTADVGLFKDGLLLFREGEAAPGVSGGRVFEDFDRVAMLDSGGVVFQADISGVTTDDSVIYLDSTVVLREGDAVVGTALNGTLWRIFSHLDANGAGDLLFEGTTNFLPSTMDAGLFLLPHNGPLTLLLHERVTPVPASSGIETIEFIDAVQIASNGNWIMRGEFVNSATVSTLNDDCAVAGIGGGAPITVAQEGDPIPELPGSTLGLINAVSINSSGDVLVAATIVSPPGTTLAQEGLFLNGNLILHDNIPIPGMPGATLTSFEVDDLAISDSGEIVFEGVYTGGPGNDGIFRAALPVVFPVEGLACSVTALNELRAAWTLPAGFVYDSIRVTLDGAVQPLLPGNATQFVTAPQTVSGQKEIIVEALIGFEVSPARSCRASVLFQTENLLMIPESNNDAVGLYRAFDGAYVGDLVHPGAPLLTPIQAVLGPDDRIYVSDQTGDKVVRFDRHGNYQADFLTATQGINDARGLAFRGQRLFVANGLPTPQFPASIVEFDLQGAAQGVYLQDSTANPFEPYDVLFLADGSALVSDVRAPGSVRHVPVGGGSSTVLFSVTFPQQLAALSNGNFVVVAASGNEIVEFTLAGMQVNVWTLPAPARGVQELGNGRLLFTTVSGVLSLDRSTGLTQTLRFGISPRLVAPLPLDNSLAFRRGDCNLDGSVNLTDAIRLLGVLFPPAGCIPDTDGIPDGAPECPFSLCDDACDANDDGSVNITDAVFLLGVLFPPSGCVPDTDGIPDGFPECPFLPPPAGGCGSDPTPDSLDCLVPSPCP